MSMKLILQVGLALILGLGSAEPVAGQGKREQPIEIQVEKFGVGGVFRPGDFTAIRLQLTSNIDEPATDVQVVWEVPEGLGDIAAMTRPVTLTRGQPLSVWMYAKLLPTAQLDDEWAVRVYRDNDGNRGEEFGSAPIRPMNTLAGTARAVPITEGMIAIVGGPRTLGLEDFNTRDSNRRLVTGHEATWLVPGISPRDLPDRWEGLDAFEAVIWTNATPREMRESTARALREYVQRGGHLVIVLPATGSEWGLGTQGLTPLHDLLPQTQPRTETVMLEDLLPVLTKRQRIDFRDNFELPIHVFESLDNYYQPLIALPKPDQRVVAVQRIVGFGRITIVGIDLNSGQLLAPPRTGRGGSFVEADVVWNRILGRRVDSLNRLQVKQLEDDKELYRGLRQHIDMGKGLLILDQISLSGQAIKGIGLAFMVFALYWALAGPGGFAILKRTKNVKHAWIAFAATSAVFTVVAWLGVWLFSEKNVVVQHLTVLDYVEPVGGEVDPNQPAYYRATSWFTVFLPGYGPLRLSLDSEPNVRNVLASFTAPGSKPTRFRNVDRFTVPLRTPADYRVPVRATTKELYARWMGPLDESWGSGFQVIEPISLNGAGQLTGTLGHSFPGELVNVRFLVIRPKRTPPKRYTDEVGEDAYFRPGESGKLMNVGSIWRFGAANPDLHWKPNDPWILQDRLQRAGGVLAIDLDDEAKKTKRTIGNMTSLNSNQRLRFLEMLSYFHQIPPPNYNKPSGNIRRDEVFTFDRHVGRELDLSAWFTRPCVVIIAELRGERTPIPFLVSGKKTQSAGLTIIRWIYPLPVSIDDVAPNPPEEY